MIIEAKAKLSYYRVSPRKVRLVVDLVRGKKVNDALNNLKFLSKKSSHTVEKLLKSAINNAKNKFKSDSDENLYIKKIYVDEGPILKRYMPRARGTANLIRKRTSHITIILGEKVSKNKTEIISRKNQPKANQHKVEKKHE